jgi:hypothetical protein
MEDIIWENVLGFMKLLVAIWLLKILINFITIYGVLALGGLWLYWYIMREE